jgi:hypothetical protein
VRPLAVKCPHTSRGARLFCLDCHFFGCDAFWFGELNRPYETPNFLLL